MGKDAPLLYVEDLAVEFPVARGQVVRAVNGISFELEAGTTLGLVGESGCGKSTTARALVGLQACSAGRILYHDHDYAHANKAQWRALRQAVQLVFQDPYASLNPRLSVADIIAEPLRNYGLGKRRDQRQRVAELLDMVGLDPQSGNRFPHEFSGGQRQRIGIARALALNPKVLICDEPVSALDVSVQAQIINLLIDLRQRLGLSLIIIAHDLAVVRHLADRLAVMYLGSLVEYGPAASIFAHPQHPYTQSLLAAVPIPDPMRARQQLANHLSGEASSHQLAQQGCAFAPRCPRATAQCQQRPALTNQPDHAAAVACWHPHNSTQSQT